MRSAATSSATVRSETPLAPCTLGPPRSSGVTSSPSALLTTAGPVNPKNVSAGWIMNDALARQVRAAAGVVAEHAHDARHDAADLAERRERLGVAVEAADPGGNECARAVVHADAGNAAIAREVDQVRELAAVGRVHRAARGP